MGAWQIVREVLGLAPPRHLTRTEQRERLRRNYIETEHEIGRLLERVEQLGRKQSRRLRALDGISEAEHRARMRAAMSAKDKAR